MKLFTIWENGYVGINEKVLLKDNGDYVGITSGIIYKKEDYTH